MRPSYTVVRNIDGVLSQVTRLAGRGYYFCFYHQLKPGKEPNELDRKLIRQWNLDQPYWKREKRRRGAAPSIWYVRYQRHYLLMATHGRQEDGQAHRFFQEYADCLIDIRKHALRICGYSIRYPRSKKTGKHQAFVRLDKTTHEQLRETLCRKAIGARYRERSAIEAEFERLPYQPYREVVRQLHGILKEVNRLRKRYVGYSPARATCIPHRLRAVRLYE